MAGISKEGMGLVFTAGFDAGPFQAGAALAIREWLGDVEPKVVSGSSMGSVTAAAFAANMLEEYIEYWRKIKPGDFFSTHWYNLFRLPFSPKLASLAPLRNRLGQHNVGERLLASNICYTAVSFDLNQGSQKTFSSKDTCFVSSPDLLEEAIVASCAVPFLFPPVQIFGHSLIDGGILNTKPARVAQDFGASGLIIVGSESKPLYWDNGCSTFSLLKRMLEVIRKEAALEEKEITIPVSCIFMDETLPKVNLPILPWQKIDAKAVETNIRNGYRKAKKVLHELSEGGVRKPRVIYNLKTCQ